MLITGWTIGWGVITAICLILGFVRDKKGRAVLPWSFFWFTLICTIMSAAWPLIQSGPLGDYRWWLVGAVVLAGLFVAFARFGVAMVAAFVLALLLFVPLTPGIANAIGEATPKLSGSGPIDEPDIEQLRLIGNPPEVDCVALATKYDLPMEKGQAILTYIPNQVDASGKGADGKPARLTTDSVNLVLYPAEYQRFYASVFTQPEMAGMVGVALANDAKLADANPGILQRFVDTTPKQWADQVFSGKISYEEATTVSCQLVGILEVFQKGSKPETAKTTWNYHAQDAISTKGDVRGIVRNNTQYEGEFLTLSITRKGQDGCWLKLGINTKDQRIAGLECEKPKPPVAVCEKPADPGEGYTWSEAACKWLPPESTPQPRLCTAPDGNQYPEGDKRCESNPVEHCDIPGKEHLPKGDPACKPEPPKMCPIPGKEHLPQGDPGCKEEPKFCTDYKGQQFPEGDERCNAKDPSDNTDDPDGVTKEPLDTEDPVETEQPVIENPSDGTENQGDSSPEVTVDEPDTSVTDPVGPPAGEDEAPSTPEDPETEAITDPDAIAASFLAVPLLAFGGFMRRRRR